MKDLMRNRLAFHMNSKTFGEILATGINDFNAQVDLPPLASCSLFNGYSSVEFGMYTGAKYVAAPGSIEIHFQIDPKRFVGRIAHELTHLEQDYLFTCLLADYLNIGVEASTRELEALQSLVLTNYGTEPEFQKLSRFIRHRNGRVLQGALKQRAFQILHDFRFAPYLILVWKEWRKAQVLVDSRGLLNLFIFDYENFWDKLQKDPGLAPHALLPLIQKAQSEMTAKAYSKKQAGQQVFRLIRYFAQSTDTLRQDLLLLFRVGLYFEREAYYTGLSF